MGAAARGRGSAALGPGRAGNGDADLLLPPAQALVAISEATPAMAMVLKFMVTLPVWWRSVVCDRIVDFAPKGRFRGALTPNSHAGPAVKQVANPCGRGDRDRVADLRT